MAAHIETLNDLFAALFRPAEGAPAIRQPQRPLREDALALRSEAQTPVFWALTREKAPEDVTIEDVLKQG